MPGNRAQFDTLSYRLSPAAAHQHNPISNRKRKLLDSRPSYRKHSTSLFLIDNFERSFRKSRIPNSQVFHSTSLLPCFLASLPPGLLASRISNRESKLFGSMYFTQSPPPYNTDTCVLTTKAGIADSI